jgi:nicotinic acid mononucleotide adenylyltransferase
MVCLRSLGQEKVNYRICFYLVSSTRVRGAVSRGFSIKYLVPDPVIEYIQQHQLYTA